MWIVGLCFRFVKTGSPARRAGLLITVYQHSSSKRTCAGGYRHFPPPGHNRDLKLAFSKPNLSLISTWPCGSVVPDCLWATYRFPAVLFSRTSFDFRSGRRPPALSCGAVPFFCIARCPIRAHERVIIVGNDSVKSHFLFTQRVKVHVVMVGQSLDLRQIKGRETDSRTHQNRFCGFARGQFENLILPDSDAVRFYYCLFFTRCREPCSPAPRRRTSSHRPLRPCSALQRRCR